MQQNFLSSALESVFIRRGEIFHLILLDFACSNAKSFFILSRARRQNVRTFYPGGAHLLGLRCALLTFELVNVVFRLGRCHTTFYAYKTSLLTRDTSQPSHLWLRNVESFG